MKRLFKLWEIAALSALCAALLASAWAQGKQNSISGSLLRLHVIAVSDDSYEQELKLRVRDRVLDYLEPRLHNAATREEAAQILGENLESIRLIAEKYSEGRQVRVIFGKETYPTTRSGDITLPAGEYDSLRVVLGDGGGHNWWGIVYPDVCLCGEEITTPAMDTEDYSIVTGADGYELKFRLVELWGKTLNCLRMLTSCG